MNRTIKYTATLALSAFMVAATGDVGWVWLAAAGLLAFGSE
jgi:hypothetical protein